MMPRTSTFQNTLTNDIETVHKITDALVKEIQVTGLAASVIKKRGRSPLTEEVYIDLLLITNKQFFYFTVIPLLMLHGELVIPPPPGLARVRSQYLIFNIP
jgi:hypothetical protein